MASSVPEAGCKKLEVTDACEFSQTIERVMQTMGVCVLTRLPVPLPFAALHNFTYYLFILEIFKNIAEQMIFK